MLVLSRKLNESIVINGNIRVCVVDIRGDKVRLGVEAPQQVPVNREEVHKAIEREKAATGSQLMSKLRAGESVGETLEATVNRKGKNGSA